MKNKILALVCFAALCSCGSNSSSNSDGQGTTTEDTTSANTIGVQNVNGNIPDTTNSISIGTDGKDTTEKKK